MTINYISGDYSLNVTESDRAIATQQAGYWRVVNEARRDAKVLEWDGLLMQATLACRAEADPDLLQDRLIELANLAGDYADSVQRQTLALNEEGE